MIFVGFFELPCDFVKDIGCSSPCNLIAWAFHFFRHWSFTRGSQCHKNWLVCGRPCWGSNRGYSGWVLFRWPLGHGGSTIAAIPQDQKIISNLQRVPHSWLTSLQLCYTFFLSLISIFQIPNSWSNPKQSHFRFSSGQIRLWNVWLIVWQLPVKAG